MTSMRLALIGSLPLVVACQHVNVAQITYEVLRAEDCRRNQLEDFCARTYASEYHEYRRMRQDFLRSEQQRQSANELLLTEVLYSF